MKTIGKMVGIIVGKIVGLGGLSGGKGEGTVLVTFDTDLITFDSDLYTFDQEGV
jgi:hypothetical protein